MWEELGGLEWLIVGRGLIGLLLTCKDNGDIGGKAPSKSISFYLLVADTPNDMSSVPCEMQAPHEGGLWLSSPLVCVDGGG